MKKQPQEPTCKTCENFFPFYVQLQERYIPAASGRCGVRRIRHLYQDTPACPKYKEQKELDKRRMIMDCIFCKIAAGEIPSKKLYEDKDVYAFYDIDPKAPTHFLVIPKEHIQSAAEINATNMAIVGKIYAVIAKLAAELGLENGYRVITNSGTDGGQTVPHLHFHVLAGRPLAWPPG